MLSEDSCGLLQVQLTVVACSIALLLLCVLCLGPTLFITHSTATGSKQQVPEYQLKW